MPAYVAEIDIIDIVANTGSVDIHIALFLTCELAFLSLSNDAEHQSALKTSNFVRNATNDVPSTSTDILGFCPADDICEEEDLSIGITKSPRMLRFQKMMRQDN